MMSPSQTPPVNQDSDHTNTPLGLANLETEDQPSTPTHSAPDSPSPPDSFSFPANQLAAAGPTNTVADGHIVRKQRSVNANLKAIEQKALANDKKAGEDEEAPSSFFLTVWLSVRARKESDALENADVVEGLNYQKHSKLPSSGLNVRQIDGQKVDSPEATIISYRKSLRKISVLETAHDSEAGPEQATTTDEQTVLPVKLPSFNTKLYSEETVYETKYHYANEARNNDFHALFKSILPEERLVDDFLCALLREILIQGRIFVSDRSICFNANILGWVTNLVVPLVDITNFEKTLTAGVFPNGIAVTTKTAKHNFATFISRDSTFEFLNTLWLNCIQRYGSSDNEGHNKALNPERRLGEGFRLGIVGNSERFRPGIPEDHIRSLIGEHTDDFDEDEDISFKEQLLSIDGDDDDGEEEDDNEEDDDDDDEEDSELDSERKVPLTPLSKSLDNPAINQTPMDTTITKQEETDFLMDVGSEIVLEDCAIIPATVPQVFTLLFGENVAFQHKYIASLDGSEISAIEPFKVLSKSDVKDKIFSDNLVPGKPQRCYQYRKGLNFSMGPKSTIVKVIETIIDKDFRKGVNVVVKTATPDVPSGGLFTVLTRYLFAWAPNQQCKLRVTFWMDWTGRSWIRGIIEKSTLTGQTEACSKLLEFVKSEIGEFVAAEGTVSVPLGAPETAQQLASPMAVHREQEVIDELEEIEKTLWDVFHTNWTLIILLILVMVLAGLQIRTQNMLQESLELQRAQTDALLGLGKGILGGGPDVESAVLRYKLKLDTSESVWEWVRKKGRVGTKRPPKKLELEDGLQQLKNALDDVFENGSGETLESFREKLDRFTRGENSGADNENENLRDVFPRGGGGGKLGKVVRELI